MFPTSKFFYCCCRRRAQRKRAGFSDSLETGSRLVLEEDDVHGVVIEFLRPRELWMEPDREHRGNGHQPRMLSVEEEDDAGSAKMVAGLERLLCDVIAAHGRREKNLVDQIATLRADLRLRKPDVCDSDSGVGEPDQFGVHVTVILNRVNGSLGFNIAAETASTKSSTLSSPSSPSTTTSTTSRTTAKDLVVSRVNPEGPSHGKLRLRDCILKVNGIDLSSSSLDEAVGAIKSADEPVVVEVFRQMYGGGGLSGQRLLTDVACQTDLTCFGSNDEARSFSEVSEYSDELRKYDIEYEEVTLSKMADDAKLGLTICCAHESESSSDVFIEKVDPEGVAGLDGRIKQGDQIIQVNGVDVHDHVEAIGLFEGHGSTVSLVVARPHLKEDMEERVDASPDLSVMDNYHPICIPEEDEEGSEYLENELGCGDVVNEKDSGVRTDESLRNDESCSEHDGTILGARIDGQLCDGVGAIKLDDGSSPTIVKIMPNTEDALDRSEAVELWVESTANGDASRRRRRRTTDAGDFCREMFFSRRPDDGELSSVACECCRQASLKPPPSQPSATTLYTDRNNLERTIRLQQRLLRHSLLAASSSSTSSGRSPSSASGATKCVSATPRQNASSSAPDKIMEWRVKRRPDGSRYVVRRPVRSRLLRDRAVQLTEERCGLTTDDDAASEMKIGRYWSKEDRKRHLDRAREHRRNKEEVIKSRNAAGNQSSSGRGILEMSRRKMTRVRGRNLFDDFTTVQEVLAHGSSGNNRSDSRTPHPLLSVTTV